MVFRSDMFSKYVLVTPVRNEERTIEITIRSVLEQTIRPVEWIIVSDASTDRTDEIVSRFAEKNDFIKLLRLEKRPGRSFGSVVFATQAGIGHLHEKGYEFIGLLDADIKLPPSFYETLMARMVEDPSLGLTGGLVSDVCEGRRIPNRGSLRDVAGAVQFFRRSCFDALGGLLAIPEGGWDVLTCVQARMHGFKTCTFQDIEVDHLKPRNVAEGNVIRRNWQLGLREYALGNHPVFEVVKCTFRVIDRPFFVGAASRFAGFATGYVTRRQRFLPAPLIQYLRAEQKARIFPWSR